MPNNFDAWFKAQFGQRQSVGSLADAALLEAVADGRRAQAELDHRSRWDAEYRAALYARNAFTAEPPKED